MAVETFINDRAVLKRQLKHDSYSLLRMLAFWNRHNIQDLLSYNDMSSMPCSCADLYR